MPGLFDRIKDTWIAASPTLLTTLSTFAVTGTAPGGYQTFSTRYAISDANIPVAIVSQTSADWMTCWCTYTSSNTLRIDTIMFSSNGDAGVTFPAGTMDIFVTPAARAIPGLREVNTFTANNYFNGGNVGIGTTSPSGTLHTVGTSAVFMDRAGQSHLLLRSSNGTVSAPTGILSTNIIGRISFQGYDGAQWITNSLSGVLATATENWSTTARGSQLQFLTTPNTTATAVERMTIDNAGNVGIGTPSPNRKLTVSAGGSDARINILDSDTTAPAAIALIEFFGSDARGGYVGINSGSVVLQSEAALPNGILFSANGAERMRITNTGNVGIGTTPSERLSVFTGGSEFAIEWAGPGKAWVLGSAAGRAYIRNKTDSVEAISILNDGKVGIGTTSPSGNLTVSSSTGNDSSHIRVETSVRPSLSLIQTGVQAWSFWVDSGDSSKLKIGVANGGVSTGTPYITTTTGGNVGIGTTGPISRLDLGSIVHATPSTGITAALWNSGGNVFGIGVSAGQLNYIAGTTNNNSHVWHTNGVETVRINGSGNVGIGTANPSSPLHVVSAANFQPQIIADHVAGAGTGAAYFMLDRARGTTSAKTAVVSGDALGTLMARGYDGSALQNAAWLSFDVDGTVSAGNVPTGITFFTTPVGGASTARAHFDADGNVGIGTTGPAYKLHVAGTGFFSGLTTFDADISLTTGADQYIYFDNALRLARNGTGDRVIIDASGNVGVGTSSPDQRLVVSGNIQSGTTGSNGALYLGGPNVSFRSAYSANVLGIYTSNVEQIRVDSSGNVGIGTSGPFCKLHVRSDVTGAAPAASGTTDGATIDRINNNIVALDTGIMGNGNIWLQGRNVGNFATSYPILLNPNPGTGITGALGFGTTAPRSICHFTTASAGQYFLFQNTSGAGGTALTSTDTYPIQSGNGFIGYGGLFLLPGRWGNATVVDSHNVLYLSGAQRNNLATTSDIAFANWGYFTGTTTAAGHLGNATAQADAVKFNIRHTDNGGEFTQRLLFIARSATGTTVNALTILSSGESVLPVVGQTDVNSVGFRGSPNNDKSADYTLALTDAGRTIRKTVLTAFTVTIPADATVNFPLGTCIMLCNVVNGTQAYNTTNNLVIACAAGGPTLVWLNGTARNNRTAGTNTLLRIGGSATLRKVAANLWTITGAGIA